MPGWGETPDQYNSMYLFDVFVFNEGRTLQRMLYDTRNWALVLIEHGNAFGTRSGRPRHLEAAPIEVTDGWREALSELSDDVLTEQLGDVLNSRRIRALADERKTGIDEIVGELLTKAIDGGR